MGILYRTLSSFGTDGGRPRVLKGQGGSVRLTAPVERPAFCYVVMS
jgi:hypothetical protein